MICALRIREEFSVPEFHCRVINSKESFRVIPRVVHIRQGRESDGDHQYTRRSMVRRRSGWVYEMVRRTRVTVGYLIGGEQG